ncbi:hypothetical protein POX_a00516 [Penicillium oxalicum]|uniref:Hydrophobin n=1 Tax=Penicillium oxalicum (strain 114-2 / CGMCC 5302) TaxID=933388 RepID=S7ZUU9_PENO1|nr:hypothetical protein POX_a00516 [Penicillium oxalicum]EPS34510.1 hypothetical protein PDE_09474 [Penicillium oxalicum 114-2]KAI2793928.1 hypothetical protein POX_a00516 [Penicillium oxalicum]
MHFTTFIYTLLTLAVTSTTAIPLSSGTPAIPSPKTKSSNLASSPVSAAATPSPTLVGAYQCPPNKYKRCCMSVQESSRELLTKVGDLVPALGGIAVSSQISFSCSTMSDAVSPNTCNERGYLPMCCDTNKSGSGLNPGCKPFEEVKEKYYSSLGYERPETQAEYINDVLS